jgi:hypothetical protein
MRISGRVRRLVVLVVVIAAALVAVSIAIAAAACGDEGDFPGEWVSARGEHVVITARDDGDYDVTFVDSNEERGEDMTFTLKRSGDKLRVDYEPDGFFIYVTLGGDRITIEQIGSIQTYLRAE